MVVFALDFDCIKNSTCKRDSRFHTGGRFVYFVFGMLTTLPPMVRSFIGSSICDIHFVHFVLLVESHLAIVHGLRPGIYLCLLQGVSNVVFVGRRQGV